MWSHEELASLSRLGKLVDIDFSKCVFVEKGIMVRRALNAFRLHLSCLECHRDNDVIENGSWRAHDGGGGS